MCTDYSPWQRYNAAVSKEPGKHITAKKDGNKHLQFVCDVHVLQYKGDRQFLHEHPCQASFWDKACMLKLVTLPGVGYVDMDSVSMAKQMSMKIHSRNRHAGYLTPDAFCMLSVRNVEEKEDGVCRVMSGSSAHRAMVKLQQLPQYIPFGFAKPSCRALCKR